jgi:hypothetical protein
MKRLIGWIALTMALFIIGAGIGLGISWGILPVKMINTAPVTLRQEDKDRYRVLIAEDFLTTRDRARAESRLDLLAEQDALFTITDQIDRNAWAGGAQRDALVALQVALAGSTASQPSTPASSPLPMHVTVSTPEELITLTATLSPASTPIKTLTPLMTSNPEAFIVLSRTPVCDAAQDPPMLQVNVVDSVGKPLRGVVLIISSVEGSERIITGLKPDAGAGSADFIMSEGIIYIIKIENTSGSSETLTTAQCTSSSGTSFPGGWKLQIQY